MQKAAKLGLNEHALAALQNPYGNIGGAATKSDAMSKSFGGRTGTYDDLESQAADMNISNNGRVNRQRKGGIPASVKNNKDFTFGVRSDNDFPSGASPKPGVFVAGQGSSSMHKIIGHSQNLVDDLMKKIHLKSGLNSYSHKGAYHKSDRKNDDLRSKSVLHKNVARGIDSQRGNNMSDLVLPAIDINVFNSNTV